MNISFKMKEFYRDGEEKYTFSYRSSRQPMHRTITWVLLLCSHDLVRQFLTFYISLIIGNIAKRYGIILFTWIRSTILWTLPRVWSEISCTFFHFLSSFNPLYLFRIAHNLFNIIYHKWSVLSIFLSIYLFMFYQTHCVSLCNSISAIQFSFQS